MCNCSNGSLTIEKIECLGMDKIETCTVVANKQHKRRCVIFLDIDGVVHPANQPAFISSICDVIPTQCLNLIDGCFRPQCLDRLKKIIDKTNALVVLSSTWREKSNLLDLARRRLAMCGISVYDTTPVMKNPKRPRMNPMGRSREINSWLQAHKSEISLFVVLDDMDMTPAFEKNCVVVDGRTGLSDIDVQKAMNRLILK